MDKTAEQIAAELKAQEEQKKAEAEALAKAEAEKQSKEEQQKNKTEVLRELSKELGINAFDPKEIKAKLEEHAQWKESQMTEQEKLMARVNEYETKETEWQSKQKTYEANLQAIKLGIPEDKINDALLLANNDPEKLKEVVEKYPTFASQQKVNIGLQQGNDNPPGANTEVEQYIKEKYRNSRYVK